MKLKIINQIWLHTNGIDKTQISENLNLSLFDNLETLLSELVENGKVRKSGELYFVDLPF